MSFRRCWPISMRLIWPISLSSRPLRKSAAVILARGPKWVCPARCNHGIELARRLEHRADRVLVHQVDRDIAGGSPGPDDLVAPAKLGRCSLADRTCRADDEDAHLTHRPRDASGSSAWRRPSRRHRSLSRSGSGCGSGSRVGFGGGIGGRSFDLRGGDKGPAGGRVRHHLARLAGGLLDREVEVELRAQAQRHRIDRLDVARVPVAAVLTEAMVDLVVPTSFMMAESGSSGW